MPTKKLEKLVEQLKEEIGLCDYDSPMHALEELLGAIDADSFSLAVVENHQLGNGLPVTVLILKEMGADDGIVAIINDKTSHAEVEIYHLRVDGVSVALIDLWEQVFPPQEPLPRPIPHALPYSSGWIL